MLVGDDSGPATGAYRLCLQRTNNPANATAINFGQTLSGTIALGPRMGAFTFAARAGDKVFVRVLDTSGTAFNPEFRLYRPDGTALPYWSGCGTYGDPVAQGVCPLDADGVHTLLIGDYGGDLPGSYRVFIQRANNPSGATPIGFDQVASGTIALAPELKAYTFPGSAGDQILVRLLDPSATTFIPQMRSLKEMGIISGGNSDGFGSNWAITGIHGCVTRTTTGGEVLYEGERISRYDAIKAYTVNGAHLEGAEQTKGSISPGKLADLVVLDKDITTCSPEDIVKARVLSTFIDGELVYARIEPT